VTACSFSPDGRRLVTVSLDEQRVAVWKVGGYTFLSVFNPGAPPRQGSAGNSEPFRTLDFNVGDEGAYLYLGLSVLGLLLTRVGKFSRLANMATAATLEWVKFEWQAERTVRLRIRESALTFSVV
jgi:WD40 repeat protein